MMTKAMKDKKDVQSYVNSIVNTIENYQTQRQKLLDNKDLIVSQYGYEFGLAINERVKTLEDRIDYWDKKLLDLYAVLGRLNNKISVSFQEIQRQKQGNRINKRMSLMEEMTGKNERVIV